MNDRFNAPLFVSIDINTVCNLNCIHCRVDKSKNSEIPIDKILDLITEVNKLNAFYIHFAGGEPFLHKGIYKILNYANRKNIPKVSISTNGTIINISKLKHLDKNKMRFNISFDGSKDVHNYIRNKKIYSSVVKNVKRLVQQGFYVSLNVTLMKNNLSEFEKIIKLAKQLKVKQISFTWLFPVFKELNYLMPNRIERAKIMTIYKKYCNEKAITILLNKEYLGFPDTFPKDISFSMGCRAGRSQMNILANGNVVGCKLLPFVIAGNIYKNNLKVIWTNKNNWYIFLNIKNNITHNQCTGCKYFDACRGGCRALAYYLSNNLYTKDPTCIY